MGRIAAAFERAHEQGRVAIAPYFTVGYPDVAATIEGIRAAIRAGADLIELGVPFSDPLADGATIQKSSTAALNNGVTLQTCLETTEKIRAEFPETPIILMGYYNPFFQYGIDKLTRMLPRPARTASLFPICLPKNRDLLMKLSRSAASI